MPRSCALVAAVVSTVFVATVLAQKKPDFTGRWVIVSPASAAGEEQVFTQDATTLTER